MRVNYSQHHREKSTRCVLMCRVVCSYQTLTNVFVYLHISRTRPERKPPALTRRVYEHLDGDASSNPPVKFKHRRLK